MKPKVLFAPQIDMIIEGVDPERNPVTLTAYQNLKDIYDEFSCIKPGKDDEIRHTWIEVDRGPIKSFGDYEEYREAGEVDSQQEFERLWKEYYPEKTKWYKFQTSKFREEKFFFLNGKLFGVNRGNDPALKDNVSGPDYFEMFIRWLRERIRVEMNKFRKNPWAYNIYIHKNLSWSKRLGRIRRNVFWDILGDDTIRLDKNLGEKTIEKLKDYIISFKKDSKLLLQDMTANMYFRLCEICYDVNNYFKNPEKSLTPREKYLKMADGRDAGLCNIDGDSPEAFNDWYHSAKRTGAHPWEICRGGNSTHISLFISEIPDKWAIRLAGSSIVRVEETVRMAVALFENHIPFQLNDMEEIVRMVTGDDFIGIVPDIVSPCYCHNLFPGEDKIIDFMNLGSDKEITPEIIKKTFWYPLEEICLV